MTRPQWLRSEVIAGAHASSGLPRGLLLATLAGALLMLWPLGSAGEEGLEDSPRPAARSPELLAEAKDIYALQCTACHGEKGAGDGEAAYLLYPQPRNFRAAYFRLTTTENRVPTDADLYRTITRGIPGSSMASWQHLPENVRWGLAYLIRDFWQDGLAAALLEEDEDVDDDEIEELIVVLTTPGQPITVPEGPEESAESRASGREIYVERCQSCHGPEGRGDGTEVQRTLEGYLISPADYTQGLFKGGSEGAQLYYRIAKGMAGTPMPESELDPEQIWQLVHYIRSLAKPGAEQNALQGRSTIRATRVTGSLSDDPLSPLWAEAAPKYIALRPLWWRRQRIDGVMVRALYNSEEISLLLSWEDPAADMDALKTTQFGDGAAVQLSHDDDPPFFGMGSAEKPVNIWHWKAAWEQDASERRDVELVYPDMAVDIYQQAQGSGGAVEDGAIPPTQVHTATFLTGQGAGNALSAPSHPSRIEDLNARSFGTLSAQPKGSQNVLGKGLWKKGIWRVVLRRSLETDDGWDVKLSPQETVRIAFAVWDGAAGDRDGQKAVSIWHELELTD